MLIGLVMYISIFKAEVGGKLRPTSQLQPAVFTYHYGYSFILYVSGFVSTEISGTCAVFLYIYWHQKDWRKKGYAVRSKLISSTMAFDIEPINNLYPFCKMHSPYMASEGGRGGGLGSDEISKTFTPTLQRRLYLDRGNGVNLIDEFYSPICLKHSLSCSMVNELLPEGIPKKQNRMVDTNDFNETCPPLSSARCPHHLTSAQSYEFFLPNCFPRTESSNAENENWKNGEQDELDECSSTATHDHDFVPFDLDETVSVPTNCKNFNDTFKEDEFLKALSKTTPV